MPCPTPEPKSPHAFLELCASGVQHGAFAGAKLGGYRTRGIVPAEPSWDPCMEGWKRPRPLQCWGTKAHPSRDTPMGPTAMPAPTQKALLAALPPAFVKKEEFFIKRKREQGPPLQPPLGGSLRSHSSPPLARLTSPCTPPPWLCTPALSPRLPARYPRTLTSSAEACPGVLAQQRPPARSVRTCGRALVLGVQLFPPGETSPLAGPPVPACHGTGVRAVLPPSPPCQSSAPWFWVLTVQGDLILPTEAPCPCQGVGKGVC